MPSTYQARRHERYGFFRKAKWDYFSDSTGVKSGYIMNISRNGCLLKASDPIGQDERIRLVIQDFVSNLLFVHVGRVVRRQDITETMESMQGGTGFTLFRYGIEFTHPSYLGSQEDLILALSSKNLIVRSCLSLNSRSSLLPGSLA